MKVPKTTSFLVANSLHRSTTKRCAPPGSNLSIISNIRIIQRVLKGIMTVCYFNLPVVWDIKRGDLFVGCANDIDALCLNGLKNDAIFPNVFSFI